ncbi:hypothetical protein RGR602_PC01763 (plasmid) [Rhizobium gallicum bv. gallicum R602sp]|uniref:Uncharacterized protein n=1 Tax=Rhizobium gallicum bv. gallicum R602sp TaxID=1041138 RepID=A0A0B4XH58_9HYPH|nr:hypothetical protein RGR602_PC01763 [Rhizobium gallicum bv. gallicum R602sp]
MAFHRARIITARAACKRSSGSLPIDRIVVALASQKHLRCRVPRFDLICEIIKNEITFAGGKRQDGVSFTSGNAACQPLALNLPCPAQGAKIRNVARHIHESISLPTSPVK